MLTSSLTSLSQASQGIALVPISILDAGIGIHRGILVVLLSLLLRFVFTLASNNPSLVCKGSHPGEGITPISKELDEEVCNQCSAVAARNPLYIRDSADCIGSSLYFICILLICSIAGIYISLSQNPSAKLWRNSVEQKASVHIPEK